MRLLHTISNIGAHKMSEEIKNVKAQMVELDEELVQIYLTGAFGGFTPHDFRMIVFNELPKPSDSPGTVDLIKHAKYELIMSPLTAKELHGWLGEQLKEYEKNRVNNSE